MVKKETESDKNGQEDNLEDIQEVSETPMDLKNTEGKKEQVPKQGCIFIRNFSKLAHLTTIHITIYVKF